MGSISCHIMTLVTNSLRRDTHASARTHTHTNTHTNIADKRNFKKSDVLAKNLHESGLKILDIRIQPC